MDSSHYSTSAALFAQCGLEPESSRIDTATPYRSLPTPPLATRKLS
ncbi:hypothetical protein [Neisseria dumasiana]|nr:hypothetical protein [Neisseria dumasiana]